MNNKRLLLILVGLCALFTLPTKANSMVCCDTTYRICDSVTAYGILITHDTTLVIPRSDDDDTEYDTIHYEIVHSDTTTGPVSYGCYDSISFTHDTTRLDSTQIEGNCYHYEWIPLKVVKDTTYQVTKCDESFVWHENTYSATGTYYYPSTPIDECPEKLELYIGHNDTIIDTIAACNEYKWIWTDSVYRVSTDTEEVIIHKQDGCDSVMKLDLTIDDIFRIAYQVHACDGYNWKDSLYTQSCIITDTIKDEVASKACDTLVTIHLVVDITHPFIFDTIVCDSYTWNDSTIYFSGNYVIAKYDSVNCVDTAKLQLMIIKSASEDLITTACESFQWNDTVFTSTVHDTLLTPNANGCKDTMRLHITIHNDILATLWGDVIVINNEHPLGPFHDIFWYHNGELVANGKEYYQEKDGGVLYGEYHVIAKRNLDNSVVQACVKDFGEKPAEQTVTVMPNPTTRFVVVKNGKWKEGETIIISDLFGKVVWQGETTMQGVVELDLAALKSGVYVARIGEDAVRIIKQD